MRVQLVGVGEVGGAIAVLVYERAWLEKLVLADYNLKRAKKSSAAWHRRAHFPLSSSTRATIAKSSRWPRRTT